MNQLELNVIKECVLAASNNLSINKNIVNDLNVFPVPDGDTGTNMNMTIKSAVKVANDSNANTIKSFLSSFSKGSLLGARGNSGVILSQLIRGFVETIPEDKNFLEVSDLIKAFNRASEVAYNAVMKPTEGTILTVSKDMAKAAKKFPKNKNNVVEFIEFVYNEGVKSLDRTPELLPILKESGVVDAGGKGLLCLVEGTFIYLMGDKSILDSDEAQAIKVKATSTNEYEYSASFNIKLKNPKIAKIAVAEFKIFLNDIASNIEINNNEDSLYLSLNINNPGKVLEKGLVYGQLYNIEISNNVLKSEDLDKSKTEEDKVYKNAFIAVSAGDGFSEVFKSLGVAKIIAGGQTMNPSTEDLLSAVNNLKAENIFILPNNSNIILSAEQVKSLSDKNVYVIPSRSMPEGVTAIFSGISEENPDDIMAAAKDAIEHMRVGEVTYAVRETKFNGSDINQGDIIAITGKDIIQKGKDVNEVSVDLVKKLYDEDLSLISIYYGEDTSEDDAEEFLEKIEELYPDMDVELNYGGQPLYYYIISIE
ncbi:DAK2 domain-containing protein [Neofamilia massiliensis]|uniref:DAK2 domain-containing protein n=1 Tax=Neofamilia massiliensis TaxID=1673724 RepID=UPI0006BB7BD0|nr:DAK2 domain-containing protein [Neofamilia massiliensis]